ncbi:Pimeloyl-[acyl-carrier protein] methyl ester esterase [Brevundimonas sp. SH203]|uniref:alpha/beta fold hydrolase n=1 Tax=Brevundimonas sp. SH203 TaxID=345167 RepID=UPI0009D4637A|nr:alpha/beta hydrolase [Brevundimonas sp. SH203]GAW41708.1 Pimeloyl-[acyl-carrier protein] methyl ester esterase [Brevundimonas sp. SH203]
MIRLFAAFAACLFLLVPAGVQARPQTPAPASPPVFVSDRIIVETRGSGPDVVFIPGLGSTGAAWRSTADRLQDRYRVHLVTLRGFGGTAIEGNANGGLAGPAAAEIERYIRQQGLVRPALIGHSLGGQIALRVAAGMGDAVGRVMVVDSSPFFPSLVDSRATAAQVEPLARLGYQALLLFGDQALKSQAANLGVDMGLAGDMVFQGLGLQGGDRRVLAQGLYEALTVDLRPRLPEITAPVTVVYGWTRDPENPRNRLEGLYRYGFQGLRRPPRFERIEGAGHQVMIEQPGPFLSAVRRFLS